MHSIISRVLLIQFVLIGICTPTYFIEKPSIAVPEFILKGVMVPKEYVSMSALGYRLFQPRPKVINQIKKLFDFYFITVIGILFDFLGGGGLRTVPNHT